MREHRLIERIIPPLKTQLNRLSDEKMIDPILIARAIKFFTHYTDLTHHGKEENILFRELEKKELSPKAKQIMKELIQDHIFARNTLKDLTEANNNFIEGEQDSVSNIRDNLVKLIMFYPDHIAKEDKTFFHPAMVYFSPEELDKMVQEFWEYDRKLIDVGYKKVVDEISLYFQDLTRWVCTICGYLYDPETASHKEIGSNIPFQELPPDFLCSFCFSPKETFEKQLRII
jgi:hemerythrin-like domain-containing protein